MRRLSPASLLCTILVITGSSARAVRAQSGSHEDASVRAVVETYLYGLKFNNVDSLGAAFWPDAKLMWIKRDGTMGQLTQPDWYRTFAKSAGKEERGDLRIAALDVTDNIASVKVVETYEKSVYVDYLNLLRIGTDWRIVNKVYASRAR